jgi:hypothetical protein
MDLTHDRVRELLAYDPETGILTWRARTTPAAFKVRVGAEAGTLHRTGRYRQIQIHGRIYKAHRLGWFHYHGAWPIMAIDHINGNPSDNRLCNLRLATTSQNIANSRRRKHPHRLKGAFFDKKSRKWRSEVTKDYKKVWVGSFDTEIEAHEAYVRAAKQIHGEYFHSGRLDPP